LVKNVNIGALIFGRVQTLVAAMVYHHDKAHSQLRQFTTATSPNVIGGYSGNIISDTVAGGTISGGGLVGFENWMDSGST
jgi:hypothetical protein